MAQELDDEKIDSLNFDSAIEYMEELGLDIDSIENVEQAQHQLRLYVASQRKSTTDGAADGDVPGILNDAYRITVENSKRFVQNLMEENRRFRMELQEIVKLCHEVLDKLPESRLPLLLNVYPTPEEDLDNLHQELNVNDCVILVAGETGAGKSTLLNLLLGELTTEFLPVAHLSSTSAITELRYSPDMKIVVHYTDTNKEPFNVALARDTAPETIAKYVHQKDERGKASFTYSKVEVHWPWEWLRDGIVIVDSPGVGEYEELTDLVKQYRPKASGVIYVINTPNAGGINTGRLQDLLFSPTEKQEEEGLTGQFNPRSAVFVCNKWDDIPSEHKDRVRNSVTKVLSRDWPAFNEEQQLFFFSAKRAITSLQDDLLTDDYLAVVKGIEFIVHTGLKTKLEQQYSVARRMMDRCQLILKSFIKMGELSKAEVEKKVKNAKRRLHALRKKPDELKETLSKQKKEEIEKAIKSLCDHLNSAETRGRLCTWTQIECNDMFRSKKEALPALMVAKVKKRINDEIKDWDTREKVFPEIYERLVKLFKKEYGFMEGELKRIESMLTTDDAYEMDTEQNEGPSRRQKKFNPFAKIRDSVPLELKIPIGLTIPVWVPIAFVLGIVSLPFYGYYLVKKNVELQKDMKEAPDEMATLTNRTIDEMITTNYLQEALQGQVERLNKSFEDILQDIPHLIEADSKLLKQMVNELNVAAHRVSREYQPIRDNISDVLEHMDCFYRSAIREYEVDFQALSNLTSEGEGEFAIIYTAQWKGGNDRIERRVFVKVKRLPLNKDNVNQILQEEENLRRLQSVHVLSFYGTGISQKENGVHPFFVMEYCSRTLADLVYDTTYKAPARCNGDMSKAAWYACQVSAGLAELHEYGLLHRDLRPESILLDNDGIVKLADLGYHPKDGGITTCIAPELNRGKKYDVKTEMFYYGAMLLVELWHGKRSNEVIQGKMLKKSRPQAALSDLQPDGQYKELIFKCSSERDQRPTAKECHDLLTNAYINPTAASSSSSAAADPFMTHI